MSDMRSIPGRILNALILGLNENKRLPRVLLMVPDHDILEYIDFFQPGKSHVIGSTLEWLINNVDRVITCKKEDLRHAHPGAIAAAESKIIWVKMFTRECNTQSSGAQNPVDSLVDTYNDILEEILSTRHGHFILDVNHSMQGLSYYTSNNKLLGHGKVKFWREVDKVIEKFDRYEISLRPLSAAEKEREQQKIQQQKSINQAAGDNASGTAPMHGQGPQFRYFKKNKKNKKVNRW